VEKLRVRETTGLKNQLKQSLFKKSTPLKNGLYKISKFFFIPFALNPGRLINWKKPDEISVLN